MKKKHIYFIVGIAILLVLFFPFKWRQYDDGTKEYSGLMLKIINWTHVQEVGGDFVNAKTAKFYFFPDNLKDFETLREEFFYE